MSTENKFSAEELHRIDQADDMRISPLREDGVTYGTPTWIWEVVVNGSLYVRAYNGNSSSWYQSALKQKAGRIYAAKMTKEVDFEPVKDSTLNKRIDEAYQQKYSQSPYMKHMTGSKASEASIKIIPQ